MTYNKAKSTTRPTVILALNKTLRIVLDFQSQYHPQTKSAERSTNGKTTLHVDVAHLQKVQRQFRTRAKSAYRSTNGETTSHVDLTYY